MSILFYLAQVVHLKFYLCSKIITNRVYRCILHNAASNSLRRRSENLPPGTSVLLTEPRPTRLSGINRNYGAAKLQIAIRALI